MFEKISRRISLKGVALVTVCAMALGMLAGCGSSSSAIDYETEVTPAPIGASTTIGSGHTASVNDNQFYGSLGQIFQVTEQTYVQDGVEYMLCGAVLFMGNNSGAPVNIGGFTAEDDTVDIEDITDLSAYFDGLRANSNCSDFKVIVNGQEVKSAYTSVPVSGSYSDGKFSGVKMDSVTPNTTLDNGQMSAVTVFFMMPMGVTQDNFAIEYTPSYLQGTSMTFKAV